MSYGIIGLALLMLAGCTGSAPQREYDSDVWWRHADAGCWVHHGAC
jgi:outer membrane biogenesis lipoprotein LolB